MHEKLIKLLGLSSSDNDGEALSAVRKANSLLKALDLAWSDVIKPIYINADDEEFIKQVQECERRIGALDAYDKGMIKFLKDRYFSGKCDETDYRKLRYLKGKLSADDDLDDYIPF